MLKLMQLQRKNDRAASTIHLTMILGKLFSFTLYSYKSYNNNVNWYKKPEYIQYIYRPKGAIFYTKELLEKNWRNVARKDVFCDAFSDDVFEFFEGVCIGAAQLNGDFVAYMEELAHIEIVIFAGLDVLNCGGEL